jgi:hypothetical protein
MNLKLNTMKIIYLILVLIVFSICGYSQNFTFSYDNSGNRIERTIILSTKSVFTNSEIANNNLEEETALEEEDLLNTSELEVQLFPNPTKGEITVKVTGVDDISNITYVVYDITGKEVLSGMLRTLTSGISLANEIPGIYSLKLNLDGNIQYWKIVKE